MMPQYGSRVYAMSRNNYDLSSIHHPASLLFLFPPQMLHHQSFRRIVRFQVTYSMAQRLVTTLAWPDVFACECVFVYEIIYYTIVKYLYIAFSSVCGVMFYMLHVWR